MAYRRKASMSRDDIKISTPSPTSPSNDLAARATRASAAHRDSSAYAYAYASPTTPPSPHHLSDIYKDQEKAKGSLDTKYGFWGVLARKAKSILDDDVDGPHMSSSSSTTAADVTPRNRSSHQVRQSEDTAENPTLRKRLDAITSSLGTAFEEGRSIMEHKTADIIQETRNKTADLIQETRKLQLRRRGPTSPTPDEATVVQNTSWQRPVPQPVNAIQETQLKASRDVAMATAAKAKLLLRELKTVKADLAFAKERCAQLEEENKLLRVSREKGDNPADDDLIRLQLETLLTEKARLAHENSIYARENRFLREIVEYHQLTMQDVVYVDESAEEVTEVSPFSIDDSKVLSGTPTSQYSPIYPSVLPEVTSLNLLPEIKEHRREAQEGVINNTPSSFSSPSSPHTVSPTSYPPKQTESSIVQTASQLVADEETEASSSDKPIGTGQAPRKPSISSS